MERGFGNLKQILEPNLEVTVVTVIVEDMAVMTDIGETFLNRHREGEAIVEIDPQATGEVVAHLITVNETLLKEEMKKTQVKR